MDYCPAARPSFGGFRCQTDNLTFDPRKLWYTKKFMVDSVIARHPNPVDAKQAQNNTQTNLLEHPLLGRL